MSRAGDILRRLTGVVESGEGGVPLIVDIIVRGLSFLSRTSASEN